MILWRNTKVLAYLVIFTAQMMLFPYLAEAAPLDEPKVETKFSDSVSVFFKALNEYFSTTDSVLRFTFENGKLNIECCPKVGCGGSKFIAPIPQYRKSMVSQNAEKKKYSANCGSDNWNWYFYGLLPIVMAAVVGLFRTPETYGMSDLGPNDPAKAAPATRRTCGIN